MGFLFCTIFPKMLSECAQFCLLSDVLKIIRERRKCHAPTPQLLKPHEKCFKRYLQVLLAEYVVDGGICNGSIKEKCRRYISHIALNWATEHKPGSAKPTNEPAYASFTMKRSTSANICFLLHLSIFLPRGSGTQNSIFL